MEDTVAVLEDSVRRVLLHERVGSQLIHHDAPLSET